MVHNNHEELIKIADLQRIAAEGAKIYEKIKVNYDPKERGKFLAIEIDSGNVYLGHTGAEALSLAKQAFPDKVFYVVKIGASSAELMSRIISHY